VKLTENFENYVDLEAAVDSGVSIIFPFYGGFSIGFIMRSAFRHNLDERGLSYAQDRDYFRVTVRNEDELHEYIELCRQIDSINSFDRAGEYMETMRKATRFNFLKSKKNKFIDPFAGLSREEIARKFMLV